MVTDATGAVVKDLRKEEFQIFEDGTSQAIAGFAFVEIPVVTASGPASGSREPDVRSNEEPFAGRIYVLVLDDLHTATTRAPRVKRAAQASLHALYGLGAATSRTYPERIRAVSGDDVLRVARRIIDLGAYTAAVVRGTYTEAVQ